MAANLELTVSQLNEYVRRMFQMDPMLRAIELKGEISNLKFHQSGALFFTMKDENASISCVMYSGDVDGLQAMPFEGHARRGQRKRGALRAGRTMPVRRQADARARCRRAL